MVVWAAAICMAFWESSVEGRKAFDKGKIGWKIKFSKNIIITKYHFFIFLTAIFLGSLPLLIYGWDTRLFGILLSAFFTGGIIEDFMWYAVNPKVKLKEFWGSFSDYFPWIRIRNQKIIPVGYVISLLIALASWYFLWR